MVIERGLLVCEDRSPHGAQLSDFYTVVYLTFKLLQYSYYVSRELSEWTIKTIWFYAFKDLSKIIVYLVPSKTAKYYMKSNQQGVTFTNVFS